MAYDATILTGSDTVAVEPISLQFLNNHEQVALDNAGHADVIESDRELSTALEDSCQLDELGEALESLASRGALTTPDIQKLVAVQLEILNKRYPGHVDALPAHESLDRIDRRELTLALENVVTETIKSMWEKIKAMFANFYKTIKTWFMKAFDGAAKLKKQAESLKAKAENMEGSPKDSTFDMGGTRYLCLNGKPATANDIVTGTQNISEITVTYMGKSAEDYNNLSPSLEKLFNETLDVALKMKSAEPDSEDKSSEQFKPMLKADGSAQISQEGTNKLVNYIITEVWQIAKDLKFDLNKAIEGDKRWDEKLHVYRYPKDLLGDKMFVMVSATPKVASLEDYQELRNGFKFTAENIKDGDIEIEDKGTYQTAQTGQVISICDATIEACNVMSKYRMLFDERAKGTERLMKDMENAASRATNLKGPGKQHINASIKTTMSIIKSYQTGETKWAKYALGTLNKAIVYSRNSLAKY